MILTFKMSYMKQPFNRLYLGGAVLLLTFLLPFYTYAQQNTEEPESAKKTISIHISKQVNGETIVIDTTIVTDGDFDADAFLREKGVMDDMPGELNRKEFTHRPPHFEFHNFDGSFPDTLTFNDKQLRIFGDTETFNFTIPEFPMMPDMHGMPEWNEQLPGRSFRFYGNPNSIDNLLQDHGANYGEMKKMVIKKKRHGKKVIITFEDKEDNCCKKGRNSEEENVFFFDQGNNDSKNEMRVVIHNNDSKSKTVTVEADSPKEKKVEKKVIIIKK